MHPLSYRFVTRHETLIIDAGWTPPTTGLVIGDWPADVAVTGLPHDWRVYSDLGIELTPSSLLLFESYLAFFIPPVPLPDHPAFLELVNPASDAADADGLHLVTGGKFPIRSLGNGF